MTGFSAKRQAALLAVLTMLLWSAVFSSTYGYSFYWDDLHFIRPYSWAEILSTFHGPTDPDGIETMALRPIATLIGALAADDADAVREVAARGHR